MGNWCQAAIAKTGTPSKDVQKIENRRSGHGHGLTAHLLWVYQGHEDLHASEGVGPGVAEGRGAVLGQVVLSEEAVDAQHPGVLHGLGKDPHV